MHHDALDASSHAAQLSVAPTACRLSGASAGSVATSLDFFAGRQDEVGRKLEEIAKGVVELKTLQMKAMSSTRYASSITPADFSMVCSTSRGIPASMFSEHVKRHRVCNHSHEPQPGMAFFVHLQW